MKFSIEDPFSKFDQIHSFLRIWSHLLEKSLTENFIFYAVTVYILIIFDFKHLISLRRLPWTQHVN